MKTLLNHEINWSTQVSLNWKFGAPGEQRRAYWDTRVPALCLAELYAVTNPPALLLGIMFLFAKRLRARKVFQEAVGWVARGVKLGAEWWGFVQEIKCGPQRQVLWRHCAKNSWEEDPTRADIIKADKASVIPCLRVPRAPAPCWRGTSAWYSPWESQTPTPVPMHAAVAPRKRDMCGMRGAQPLPSKC